MSLTADLARVFLYYPFCGAVPFMKPESVYRFAHMYHKVKMRSSGAMLRKTMKNLSDTLKIKQDECVDMANRSLLYKTFNEFDNIIALKAKPDQINRIFALEGRENIDAALSAGKGVIATAIHCGTVTGILISLSANGYKTNSIHYKYEESKHSSIGRKINERKFKFIREISSGEQLWATDPWTRTAALLRRGEIVIMYFDGLQGNKLMPVNLMDNRMYLSPGTIYLAIRTGARILPFVSRRLDNGFSVIKCLEPMNPEGRRIEDVSAILQELCGRIEPHVQQDPAQWQHWDLLDKHLSERMSGEGTFPGE